MSAAATAARRVLLIDDEHPFRELVRDALSAAHYQVDLAMDGASGLRAIDELEPAIVLVDLRLPGIDGFEVLRRLQAGETQHQPTYVVAVSAYTDRDSLQRLEALGVTLVLPKPFSLTELNDFMATLV